MKKLLYLLLLALCVSCSKDEETTYGEIPDFVWNQEIGPGFMFQIVNQDGSDWIEKNKIILNLEESLQEYVCGFNMRIIVNGQMVSERTDVDFKVAEQPEINGLWNALFYDSKMYTLTSGDNSLDDFSFTIELSNDKLWTDGSWHSISYSFHRLAEKKGEYLVNVQPVFENSTYDGSSFEFVSLGGHNIVPIVLE